MFFFIYWIIITGIKQLVNSCWLTILSGWYTQSSICCLKCVQGHILLCFSILDTNFILLYKSHYLHVSHSTCPTCSHLLLSSLESFLCSLCAFSNSAWNFPRTKRKIFEIINKYFKENLSPLSRNPSLYFIIT